MRDGRVLHEATLPENAVRQVVKICEARGCDLVMYIGDGIYFKAMNDNLEPVYGHLTRGMHAIGDWKAIQENFDRVNKCLVVTSDQEPLFEIESVFKQELDAEVEILHKSD